MFGHNCGFQLNDNDDNYDEKRISPSQWARHNANL